MRLPMKPSQLLATTPTFPMRFAVSRVVTRVSGAVAAPRTTSQSFMTLAGEKKCVPTTSPGREVALAISSMDRYEVLEASTAPFFATLSSWPKTFFLISMVSNTASTIRSASLRSSYESVGLISPIRCSTGSLGKEDMLERRGLRIGETLADQRALASEAFRKRQVHRRLHRVHDPLGRIEVPPLLGEPPARGVEEAGRHRSGIDLHLGDPPESTACFPACKCASVFDEIALDDLVDRPQLERRRRPQRIPRGDDVECRLDPDQTRQALRSARARQDAELDFGQPDLGGRRGHPIIAGQRDLEAAAESRTMDRRDQRLRESFQCLEHIGKGRRFRRPAEFRDVGPGHEGTALARDHDRLDRSVLLPLREPMNDRLPHTNADRVHRWVVDENDADIAARFEPTEHGSLLTGSISLG